jgi:hypothetical protein
VQSYLGGDEMLHEGIDEIQLMFKRMSMVRFLYLSASHFFIAIHGAPSIQIIGVGP